MNIKYNFKTDFLLHVDKEASNKLIDEISLGDLMRKPGWIRMSIHPTTTTTEIEYVCNSIKSLAKNHKDWILDYDYNKDSNEVIHKKALNQEDTLVKGWFSL